MRWGQTPYRKVCSLYHIIMNQFYQSHIFSKSITKVNVLFLHLKSHEKWRLLNEWTKCETVSILTFTPQRNGYVKYVGIRKKTDKDNPDYNAAVFYCKHPACLPPGSDLDLVPIWKYNNNVLSHWQVWSLTRSYYHFPLNLGPLKLRIKKTRILVRSARSEALRTILIWSR